jgi:Uma2 family endonuclease
MDDVISFLGLYSPQSILMEFSQMVWVNTSPLVKTYTLEEFWELPEPPDHSKLELIAGVLYMTPPPGYLHDNAVSRIIRLLSAHLLKANDQGKLYVPRAAIWTSRNTYLEPDLFYVSKETESKLEQEFRTTADLVVEVVSPGSAIYDRNTKSDTYAALGVRELWLVDETAKMIERRLLVGDRYHRIEVYQAGELFTSYLFPELNFAVDDIFSS